MVSPGGNNDSGVGELVAGEDGESDSQKRVGKLACIKKRGLRRL